MADEFEPKIVAFLCKWCSSAGSDLAGVSRMQYPPNVVPIQVMCSGSVSPLYIFNAFKKGADGVLVSGCHPGDCHYIAGNYYARRRATLRSSTPTTGVFRRRESIFNCPFSVPYIFFTIKIIMNNPRARKTIFPLKK